MDARASAGRGWRRQGASESCVPSERSLPRRTPHRPDAPEARHPPPRELSGSEPGLLPPGLEVGPASVGHFRLARLFLRALGKLRHETEMNVGGRELL